MTSSGEVGRTRRAEPPWKSVVERSEAQFFRDQAERILDIAKRCSDPAVRSDLTTLAADWVEKARQVSASSRRR
jgi:hypothetical protein